MAVVAVPGSETTEVPSPQFTVTLVGEFVVEKLTVTSCPMTAGFGVREFIVTVGAAPPAETVITCVAVFVELPPVLSWTTRDAVKGVVVVTVYV